MAEVVKTVEKITRLSIMFGVYAGDPRRKDLIRSVPLLRGLSSAKMTRGMGIIPSLPRVCIKDSG